MGVHLVTYSDATADAKYARWMGRLTASANSSGQFDRVYAYTRDWLVNRDDSRFYWGNRELMDATRGAGFWIWKSHIILRSLDLMKDNDVLLYMDCGDIFVETDGLRDFLENRMNDTDILLTMGAFPNRDWTKRDAFILLKCDEKKYWDATQVEAGILVIKNTKEAREFINKWRNICLDRRIISDDENACGFPNFDSFKQHRWDQSALGLLCQKEQENGGPCKIERGHEMREWIDCNRAD